MRVSVRSVLTRTALAAAVVVPAGLVTAESAAAVTNAEMETKVIKLVNAERRKAGCADFRVSTQLRRAARKHSHDMRTKNYFSHTSKDGRSPWQRIRAEGYEYGSAENIAAGQISAYRVVKAWMTSPGHRKNILNCSNKAIGVGVSRGPSAYRTYWTQDFGRR
ncbi:CAP domain-containing protein [Phycicoccus sp. CSK15P-2]|uniref:CAP domain-containing protein n=1 Tax=Phycicoccus sp. CSK15P-2 TaxID=2807627 RepID=UPI00194FB64B|nr:CAP domain-containing protein [Phycicoccus sp. CSK15P-2]MBM6406001.1 CAP domain-containing protein [Phycicoccus sp. CSK15P-2]